MKLQYSRSVHFAGQILGQGIGPSRPSAGLSRSSSCMLSWHSRRTVTNTPATPKNSGIIETSHPGDGKTAQSAENNLSLSDQVRLLMRHVPHPVAIITATDPGAPVDSAFRGMTVSSFNTVTLNPQPVISFNVRRPSETLNALVSSGRFLVHLLAPTPATATLARDFSRGNHNLSVMSGEGEFEFTPLLSPAEHSSDRPLPILRRRRRAGSSSGEQVDFPFVFECRFHPQKIEVHDHTVVLGTVVRTIQQHTTFHLGLKGGRPSSASDLCLTYADTRFWKMGDQI